MTGCSARRPATIFATPRRTSSRTRSSRARPPWRLPPRSDTTPVATISGLLSNTTYYVALKVTDNQGNAVRSASLPASTMHLTARKVAFIAQPSEREGGVALAPITVEIQDAAGLRVDNAALAVTLTVQGVTGFGPFTVTSDKGVATFTGVRIDKAGTGYTLRATSPSLTPEDSQPFDITHADATRLELAGLGPKVRAGADNSVTVTVRDAFDNVVENYTGTVSFASSDTAAGLPAPYPSSPPTRASTRLARWCCAPRARSRSRCPLRPCGRHAEHGRGPCGPEQAAADRAAGRDAGGRLAHRLGRGAGRLRRAGHGLHRDGGLQLHRRQGRRCRSTPSPRRTRASSRSP